MLVTRLDKVNKIVPKMEGAKDIYKQVPLSKADGSPNFSFRVFFASRKSPLLQNIFPGASGEN